MDLLDCIDSLSLTKTFKFQKTFLHSRQNPFNQSLILTISGYFCCLKFFHEEYTFHPKAH